MTLEEAKQAVVDYIEKTYPANIQQMVLTGYSATPLANDIAYWENILLGLTGQPPKNTVQTEEKIPAKPAAPEQSAAEKERDAKAKEDAKAGKDFEVTPSKDGESVIVTGYKVSRLKDGRIPSHINGKPVTGIADRAFAKKGIKKLIIPETITFIGESAFERSNLESINLPPALTVIGKRAFAECIQLAEISIPGSVTEISSEAFITCRKLEKVTLISGIAKIGQKAFNQCGVIEEIVIPDSVKTIGDEAFKFCKKLAGVTIGKGVTGIGNEAFFSCAITNIVFSGTVAHMGEEAFALNETLEGDLKVRYTDDAKSIVIVDYEGKGKSVTFPAQMRGLPVTQILWGAISGRGLGSITIPDNVIVGEGSGVNRPHVLKTITIGSNVKIEGGLTKAPGGAYLGNVFDRIDSEKVKDFIKDNSYLPVALIYKNNGYKAGTFTRGTSQWDFKIKNSMVNKA